MTPIIWAEVDVCISKRFDGSRMGDTKFKFWMVSTNQGVVFRSILKHHCDRVVKYLRSEGADLIGVDDAAFDKKWDTMRK